MSGGSGDHCWDEQGTRDEEQFLILAAEDRNGELQEAEGAEQRIALRAI
jgi:hypothetical protein